METTRHCARRRRAPSARAGGGALLALAAACTTVGPDYEPPEPEVAEQWLEAEDPRLRGAAETPGTWWSAFDDPLLQRLIEAAHARSPDVRIAAERVLEARALYGIATGNRYPQVQQAFAEYVRTTLSDETAVPPIDRRFGTITAGVDVSWELDLWGRFARAIEAAGAELEASQLDLDDVLVVLLADVGTAYVELRTFQERLRLARDNAEIQRRTLELVQARFDQGVVGALDVRQAEVNLSRTESRIPALDAGARQAANLLCFLTGSPPRDLEGELGQAPIPVPPASLGLGIPADLLRQRPDVRRAERRLAAQCARIGVATADLYPALGLGGSIGLQSEKIGDLFTDEAFFFQAGPGVRWPFLNYGRLQSAIDFEEARFSQFVGRYENVVLAAQREAEDALVEFLRSHDRVAALQRTVASAEAAVELGSEQYRGGLTDFNRVFSLQTSLVEEQDQLALAQGDVARSAIAIFRALGGGWQIRLEDGAPPPELP